MYGLYQSEWDGHQAIIDFEEPLEIHFSFTGFFFASEPILSLYRS